MSYSNNPNSIKAGSGIIVTPSSGTGAEIVTITATGGGLVSVRIATTTPIVPAANDYIISVELATPGPAAVNLPAGITGTVYWIKDGNGTANANTITVTPSAGTIDGAANALINTSYGSLTLVYTGTKWEII